jgi:ubiquinone/menaquinone biosynthesis C-methylase UbiE
MARTPTVAGELPDEGYFDVMAANAGSHWWYEARRVLVADLLADRLPPGATAVDVGCGTGEVMAVLVASGASRVVGTDLSPRALAHAASREQPAGSLVAARAEQLPLPAGSADVLVSLEVIEHLDVDLTALQEYRRVLRAGGTLLVTVPAYESLWSEHDEWAGHRRRYGSGQLRRVVERAGFDVERVSYYFSFLVPFAFALRRTPLRRLVSSTDEAASSSPLVSRVMTSLCGAERAMMRRIDRLPCGLSILALATAR